MKDLILRPSPRQRISVTGNPWGNEMMILYLHNETDRDIHCKVDIHFPPHIRHHAWIDDFPHGAFKTNEWRSFTTMVGKCTQEEIRVLMLYDGLEGRKYDVLRVRLTTPNRKVEDVIILDMSDPLVGEVPEKYDDETGEEG